jgi:hypothetical protein
MKPSPREEGSRWLLQAQRDLDDARYAYDGKRYNLACFLAQHVIQFVESRFPSQEALTDEGEGEEND